ncbi:unnamed protein product [Soboliphyme baturini]|uniref:Uncharacterized protein n=1 Tax=Soboliphyme baturini TaxID=241478 RepID=A0A183J1F4_9BILA|nr:unnamed protein product [Soboliphyme baturini]
MYRSRSPTSLAFHRRIIELEWNLFTGKNEEMRMSGFDCRTIPVVRFLRSCKLRPLRITWLVLYDNDGHHPTHLQ